MGICNQLGQFSSELSAAVVPLRELLKTKNTFLWTADHDNAFEKVKRVLSKSPILAVYDPKRPTRLETDASRLFGLGFDLLQQHEDGSWRLIMCGSRFLRDVETRYAMLELECLAIEFAIDRKSVV